MLITAQMPQIAVGAAVGLKRGAVLVRCHGCGGLGLFLGVERQLFGARQWRWFVGHIAFNYSLKSAGKKPKAPRSASVWL